LVIPEFCCTFAFDGESQKRLVACHRVFFDAIHSRTRRLERSLIRNPQNPQSPKLPLYKEILQILPKLCKKNKTAKEMAALSIKRDVIS
jgi:hypothetical protein